MTQTLKPRHDERDVAGLEAARPVRTGENRPNGCPSILPAAVHAQVEWDTATTYADGCAEGYAQPPETEHREVLGWKGDDPGACGVECACGVAFDNFDTLAEASALLDQHIAAATQLYTAADVLALVAEAYTRGRYDGEVLELQAIWGEHTEPHLTREQRVALRVAEMEARCERTNLVYGRPPGYRYRGGPVDWDTGLPAGSPCAWLRRRQAGTSAPSRPALRSVA